MNYREGTTMIRISLLLIILSSLVGCSTSVILPGLCYNDRDGTHMCPKTEEDYIEKIDPPTEPINEHEERWNTCEPFLHMESEAWMNCMMIA